MRPVLPRALTALVGLLATFAVGVPTARADEIAVPASDGSFAIEGHGWGHGRGMSQYGAQGAAQLGKTADQITSFYYPGTAKQVYGNTQIRVLLQEDEGIDLQVLPATGLKVTDTASGAAATLPGGRSRWRITHDSTGFRVASLVGSRWTTYVFGGHSTFVGPVRFSGPSLVRVLMPDGTSRDYRGAVQAGYRSTTGIYSVAVMPMEDYLFGVVPRESSSSWMSAALQAQAIAARSYAAYKREHAPSSQVFDICDSTQCQVFGGTNLYSAGGTKTALEAGSTNDAVKATNGVVRTYQGKAIFAEFSASNGGWTVAGDVPYLVAEQDDWDGVTGSSVHSWTATLTAAELQARFPAVGTLKRLRVTARDGHGEWGGRVQTVTLEGVDSSGNATSVQTTGVGVYSAHSWPASSTGLRSSWWHVKGSLNGTTVVKSGNAALVQSPGNSTGQLAVQMRNTGTQGWPVDGIHLTSATSPGTADALVGGSTRPGVYSKDLTNPGSSVVAVGDTAEFRFDLTADKVKPGTYARSYRLRVNTGGVFGSTVSWTISVAAPVFTAKAGKPTSPDAASGSAPPAVFADGRTVVVPVSGATHVTVPSTNSGNLTWPTGSTVRLATSGARNRSSASAGSDWVTPTRPASLSGDGPVGPGQTGSYDLVLHGNSKPAGTTVESFEPVWDGQHWLDGAVSTLTVVRVDPSQSRLAERLYVSPKVTLLNSPTAGITVRVRLRNLGGDPWTVGTEGLTTTSASPFATSAWSSSSRPPALSSNLSRPGQSAVYPGELGEWLIPLRAFKVPPGSYSIGFRPVGPSGTYGPTSTLPVTVTKAVFSASLVAAHPRVTMTSKGTARTWFDVKNTGNVAWPIGHSSSVRSASFTHGGSPSHDPSWLSALRPGTILSNLSAPGATSVAPGQTARFFLLLNGNGRSARTVSEPFGLVWESWATAALRVTLSYRIS